MYKGQMPPEREPLPRIALRVCWNLTRNDKIIILILVATSVSPPCDHSLSGMSCLGLSSGLALPVIIMSSLDANDSVRVWDPPDRLRAAEDN